MNLRGLRRAGSLLGALVALGLLVSSLRAQQATLCAEVKLEILQEATLEREAFDANLQINNSVPDKPLTNLRVSVSVTDEAGAPADGAFFIRISTLTGVNAVDGTGVIQSSSTADIHWLIIPSTGAGGSLPQGRRYGVKASISGLSDGAPQNLVTFEDFITVKPQPALTLEYVIPYEVFGDEPLTDALEPIEPFPLGVRVTNVGFGPARDFKIDSAQPRILENKLNLQIDFRLLGTVVGGKVIPDTLLVPFGDIQAGAVGQASWIMSTTLSGRFVEFTSTFTHAAELGGALTSLIQSVTTYTLLKDVLVDLPGRDATPDFLVNRSMNREAMQAVLDGGGAAPAEAILESDQAAPIPVVEVPASVSGELGGTNATLVLTFDNPVSSNIWVHASVPFTPPAGLFLQSARAADGRTLGGRNAWISKHFRKSDGAVLKRLNILDLTTSATYYTVQFDPNSLDQAPGRVTDLVAESSPVGGQLDLSWTAPGEDAYQGHILGGRYLIQHSISTDTVFEPEAAQVRFATSTAPGRAQSLRLSGLIGNATTQVALWIQDTGGQFSSMSNVGSAYALPYPPHDLVLLAVGSDSAHAGWLTGNNALPVEYQVSVATDAGAAPFSSTGFVDSFTTHYVFALTPNASFQFYGSALNPETGAQSQPLLLASTVSLAADPVALPYADVLFTSMTAVWGTNGNPEDTQYYVELATAAPRLPAPEDEGWTALASGWVLGSSHVFTGLFAQTNYQARVKARNRAGVETAWTELGVQRTQKTDVLPPRTALSTGTPSVGDAPVYVTTLTPVGFTAVDDHRELFDADGVGGIRTFLSLNGSTYTVVEGTFTLAVGTHTLDYYSADFLDNVESTHSVTVYVDVEPPVTVAIMRGRETQLGGILVNGGSTLTFRSDDAGSGTLFTYYAMSPSTIPVLYNGEVLGPFPGGSFGIQMYSEDRLGNREEPHGVGVFVDTIPPVSVAALSGPSSQTATTLFLRSASTLTITATDATGAGAGAGIFALHVTLDGNPVSTVLSGLPEGAHTLTHAAEDQGGNVEAAHTRSFTVDDTPPGVAPVSPVGGVYAAQSDVIPVRFDLTDALDPAPRVSAALVQLEDRGSPRGSRPGSVSVTAGQDLGFFALDDGLWRLEATATDAVGNSTTVYGGSFEVTFPPDALPPRTSLTATPSSGGSGILRVAPGVPISLVAVDDLYAAGDGLGYGVRASSYAINGSSYSLYTGPFSLTESGTYQVSHFSEDVYGQVGAVSTTTVILDDAPPLLDITGATDGEVLVSANVTLTVTYSDPAGIDLTPGSFILYVDGQDRTAAASIGPAGASLTVSLGDGPHRVWAQVKDKLGNLAADSLFFKVDRGPNVIASVLDPAAGDAPLGEFASRTQVKAAGDSYSPLGLDLNSLSLAVDGVPQSVSLSTSSPAQAQWQAYFQVGSATGHVSEQAFAVERNRLFMVGGRDSVGLKRGFRIFTPDGEGYFGGVVFDDYLPFGVAEAQIAVEDNVMYLAGGMVNGPGTDVPSWEVWYSFLYQEGRPIQWKRSTPIFPPDPNLGQGAVGAAAVVVPGAPAKRLYLLGGKFNQGFENVLSAPIQADKSLGAWQQHGCGLQFQLQARRGLRAVHHGGYVYAAGGDTGSGPLNLVVSWPVAANAEIQLCSAQNLTSLPQGRTGGALFVHDGRLYYAGGRGNSGPSAQVFSAPLTGGGTLGAWVEEAGLPGPMLTGGGGAINGTAYAAPVLFTAFCAGGPCELAYLARRNLDTRVTAARVSAPASLAEGGHVIEAAAADLRGVSRASTRAYIVDLSSPVSRVETSGSSRSIEGVLQVAAQSALSIVGADPLVGGASSGVDFTRVSVDGGTEQDGARFFVGGGSHTLSFYSRDRAGNQEAPQSVQLYVDGAAPAATGDLAVTGVIQTQATLGWSSVGEDGLDGVIAAGETRIAFSTFTAGLSSAAAQYAAPLTEEGAGQPLQAMVTGLLPGTSYFFALWTRDTLGNWSAPSNVVFAYTPGVPDTTPPVTALAVSTAAVEAEGRVFYPGSAYFGFVSTDTESGVARVEYRLDGSTDAFSVYTGTFSLAEGARSLEWAGVDVAGNRETASTAAFVVDASAPLTVLDVSGVNGPAPGGALAVSTSTLLVLSAADGSTATAVGVAATLFSIDGPLGPGATVYASPFVLASGTYTLRFASVDRVGNAEAEKTQALVVSTRPVNAPPASVTDLLAATGADEGSLSLAWTAPDDDATPGVRLNGSYLIQRSTEASPSFDPALAQLVIATVAVPGEAQSLALGALLGNATHQLRLWTRDDEGAVSAAAAASAYARPNPPQGLVLSEVSSTSARADWQPGDNAEPVEYQVFAATAADGTPASASPFLGAATPAHVFEGLAPDTTYFFLGFARDSVTLAAGPAVLLGSTRTATSPFFAAASTTTVRGLPEVEFNATQPVSVALITASTSIAAVRAAAGGQGLAAIGRFFELGPHGATFTPPAELVLRFSTETAAGLGVSSEAVTLHQFVPGTGLVAVPGQVRDEAEAAVRAPIPSLSSTFGLFAAADAPTIASIAPDTGANNGPKDVLVTGTGFQAGAALELRRLQSGAGTWTATGNLPSARGFLTMTRLLDGRVLAAFGSGPSAGGPILNSAVYDPATGAWSATGAMSTTRTSHAAALLPDGRVLVAGGGGASGAMASAEIYDPATNSWSPTGAMGTVRQGHVMVALADGRVLAFGGQDNVSILLSAEVYDPATGAWTGTGAPPSAHLRGAATRLADGRVLALGGVEGDFLETAHVYDPVTGAWSATGSMAVKRHHPTATLLPDGRVLVAGGENSNTILHGAELYDPATGTWSTTGSMAVARRQHGEALLLDGKVLVVGGVGAVDPNTQPTADLASAELYDPAAGTWSGTGAMSTTRFLAPPVALQDGRVLMAGGGGAGVQRVSSELYGGPASLAVTATGVNVASAETLTGTFDLNGRPLGAWDVVLTNPDAQSATLAGGFTVVTPPAPAVTSIAPNQAPNTASVDVAVQGSAFAAGATLKLIGDGLPAGAWTATGSQSVPRMWSSLVPLADGRVLAAGGYQNTGGPHASAEVYDPASGAWTVVGPMSEGRANYAALRLNDGRVLVAGGEGGSGFLAGAELYDPATQAWSATGAMTVARSEGKAALLPDGRVLVAGGRGDAGALDSADIYDPAAGTWSAAAPMSRPRYALTLTAVGGKLLAAGGAITTGAVTDTTELYDPATGLWLPGAPMVHARGGQQAVLLADGRLLLVGGGGPTGSAELYDPVTGAWSPAATMSGHWIQFALTRLADQRVLASGGRADATSGVVATAELYDPETDAWSTVASMGAARQQPATALLADGRVLTAAGSLTGATAELFDAPAPPVIMAAGVTVAGAANLSGSLPLTGHKPGPRHVVVTNPDGQSGTLANGFTVLDGVAPSPVADLRIVEVQDSVVTLGWSAPVDQGGPVASYDLRHAAALLDADNFDGATPAAAPAPASPRAAQTAQVTGVTDAVFFAALKSADAAGNVSALSNVVSFSRSTVLVDGSSEMVFWAGQEVSSALVPEASPEGAVVVAAAQGQGLVQVSSIYELGPEGAVFTPPASLLFRYSPAALVPLSIAEADLKIYQYVPGTGLVAVAGQALDTGAHTITVPIPTLASRFAVFGTTSSLAACGGTVSGLVVLDSDLVCAGDGLTVTASGTTVDCASHTITFSTAAAGVGLRVDGAADVTVTRCNVVTTTTTAVVALQADGADRLRVERSTFTAAVRVTGGSGLVFAENRVDVENRGDAVSVVEHASAAVSGNFFRFYMSNTNLAGLRVTYGTGTLVTDNVFQGRYRAGAVSMSGGTDLLVSSNSIVTALDAFGSGCGVEVYGTTRAVVDGNSITLLSGSGCNNAVRADGGVEARVTRNVIESRGVGVMLGFSTLPPDSEVSSNTIRIVGSGSGAYGIYVDGLPGATNTRARVIGNDVDQDENGADTPAIRYNTSSGFIIGNRVVTRRGNDAGIEFPISGGTPAFNLVSSNVVVALGPNAHAALLRLGFQNRFENNVFEAYGAGGDALRFESANQLTVSDNRLRAAGGGAALRLRAFTGAAQSSVLARNVLVSSAAYLVTDSIGTNNLFTDGVFASTASSVRFVGARVLPASVTVGSDTARLAFNEVRVSSDSFLAASTAQVTLQGLSFSSPVARVDLEDGSGYADCAPPLCAPVAYGPGSFTFDVAHFTGYASREGAVFVSSSTDGAATLSSNRVEESVTAVAPASQGAAFAAAGAQGFVLGTPDYYELSPSPVVFDPPALLSLLFDPSVVDAGEVAIYRFMGAQWSSAPIAGQTVTVHGPSSATVSGYLAGASLYAAFAPAPDPLTVTSLTPSSATAGATLSVTAAGTGFDAATTLALERPELAQAAWTAGGSFGQARFFSTLVKLADGRALLAGGMVEGDGTGLTQTDVYDPATGAWTALAPMNQGRRQHVAALLADGRVMVTGGASASTLGSAEAYDPATGAWTTLAPMSELRAGHVMTRLADGRVLVAGGWNGSTALSSAELYDPLTGAWSSAGAMSDSRINAALTVLGDGKVLVTGGNDNSGTRRSADIYDPATNAWTPAAAMVGGRYGHHSARLPDGRVLVSGGADATGSLTTAEVYDPAAGTWTPTGPLAVKRYFHGMVLIGGVPVIVGGENQSVSLATTELYDAASNAWRAGPSLTDLRAHLQNQTVLLDDGRVLVAGGRRGLGGGVTLNTSELLAAPTAAITLTGVVVDGPQSLSGSLDLTGAATGYWDAVARSGERSGRLEGGFLVLAAPVPPVALSAITVLPSSATVAVGGSQVFSAVGTFSDGSTRAFASTAGAWQAKAGLGTARADAAGAYVGGKLYVIGGSPPAGSATTAVEAYDPATDAWTSRAPAPISRAAAAAAVHDGKVYVVGGCINSDCGSTTGALYVYDPAADSWTQKASMPNPRYEMTFDALDGKLYAVGGFLPGHQVTNLVQAYDPATDSWTGKASMPFGRGQAAAGVIGGKLYVANGQSSTTQEDELQVYDPVANSWSQGPVSPLRRSGDAGAVIGGKLYVMGGISTGAVVSEGKRALVFDPAANAWSEGPALSVARYSAAASAGDGRVFVAGGGFTNNAIPDLEVLSLASEVVWSVDAPAVATVTAQGVATGLSAGSAQVIASSGAVSGSATLTVEAPSGPTLAAIAVLPSSATVAAGGTQAFSAVGTFSDGSTRTLSGATEWAELASMPLPRRLYAAAAAGGKLYVLGGLTDAGTATADVQVYDVAAGSWSQLPPMPGPRTAALAAAVGGKVYLIGGCTVEACPGGAGSVATVSVYDTATGVWTMGQDMPTPRYYVGGGVIGGKIHVAGGFVAPSSASDALEVYDPATDSWTSRPAMGAPHWAAGFAVLGDELYVMGGFDASSVQRRVDVYDASANAWTRKADLPDAWRYGLAGGALGGKVYAIGGTLQGSAEPASARVDVYDPATDAWSAGPALSAPRGGGLSTIEHGGRLYLAGGGDAAGLATTTLFALGGSEVVWSVDAPAVATVTAQGVATGLAAGMAQVIASSGAVTGFAMLTVEPVTPTLTSIAVLPATATVAAGDSQAFTAVGTFSDGSTRAFAAAPGEWTSRAPLASARTDAVGAFAGGRFLVFGGHDGGATFTSVEAYDPAVDSWAFRAPSPVARSLASAAVLDGKVYIVGGCINSDCGNATGQLWLYDPATDGWTQKASLPTPRYETAFQAVGGKLYAAGGYVPGHQPTSSVQAYDPVTDSWSSRAPMPLARADAASGVIGGRLYVSGGQSGTAPARETQIYDPASDSWSAGAPAPLARQAQGSGVVAGRLVVAAGFSTAATTLDGRRTFLYDPLADAWSEGPLLTVARFGPAAASDGMRLYAAGSSFANQPLADLETLEFSSGLAWSVDAPAVATVTAQGVVTGLAAGTAQVIASSGAVSGFATLTVNATYFVAASTDGLASLSSNRDDMTVTPVSTGAVPAAYAAAVGTQSLAPAMASLYELTPSPVAFDPPALLSFLFDPTQVDTTTLAIYRYNDPLWSSAPVTAQSIEYLAPDLARISGRLASASLYGVFYRRGDELPPVTTLLVNGAPASGPALVIVSTDSLGLAATDEDSGVAQTFYALDGTTTATVYASTFSLAAGSHTLAYWSVDGAGNVEAVKTAALDVRLADDAAPSLTLTPVSGSTLTTATPGLLALYSDAGRGIDVASVRLTLDGVGVSTLAVVTASSASFTPSSPLAQGAHEATARVADLAGNESAASTVFYVDSLPPVTTLLVNGAPASGPALVIVSTDSLGFAATDAGAGVAQTLFALDGASTAVYASTFSLAAGSRTLAYWSVDLAGNVEAPRDVALTVNAAYFAAASSDGVAALQSPIPDATITPVSTASVAAAYAVAVGTQGLTLAGALYELEPSPVTFDPPALLSFLFDPTQVDTATIAIYRYNDPLWSSAPIAAQSIEYLGPTSARISGYLASASLYGVFFKTPAPGDAQPPLVRILYPSGSGVEAAVGGLVRVGGEVSDASAASWTLTAGSAALASGGAPASGELAAWDTSAHSGAVTLTLSAQDAFGNSASTSVSVFVGDPVFAFAMGRKDSDVVVPGLKGPTGVAARADGALWVATAEDEDRLFLLSSSGTVLAVRGGEPGYRHDERDDGRGRGRARDDDDDEDEDEDDAGSGLRFKSPQGLALDAAGNLYVADKGNDRILKLSPDGASVLLALGRVKRGKPKGGSGPGEFRHPWDVAVDGNGDIYVADAGNRRIQVFDASGAYLREFGAGVFLSTSEIRGLALTAEGLWVSDKELSHVVLFSRAGAVLRTVDDADSVVGEVSRTRGLASDRAGNLYVVEPNRDRVQKFDPQGRGLLAFGPRSEATPAQRRAKRHLTQPLDAALAPDGSLWVTDTGRDRVVRYALPAGGGSFGVASTGGGHGGRAEPARRLVEAKDGARVERDDGTGVSVPKDALAADLEITVDAADENADAEAKRSKKLEKRLTSASDEVEYGPEGTRFAKPVTLTIAYAPAPGLDERGLKVHYWNPATKDWEALDSVVDTQAKTVSAQTTHFSVYQVQGSGGGGIGVAAVDDFGLRDQYAFPNPSRRGQAVTFRVQPGRADSVELRVYDLAGRRVHGSSDFRFLGAVDDGNGKGAQNTYDHVWDVSGVGSGVYYYVMTAKRSGQSDITVKGKVGVIK